MTETTTIDYVVVTDCVERYGSWTGDRSSAIEAGISGLEGERVDGGVRYYADETSSHWIASEDDVATLGAALLSGATMADAYSIWCASSDAVEDAANVSVVVDVSSLAVFTPDDDDDEASLDPLSYYVSVSVAVDGGEPVTVGTMVGARDSDHGSVRASGAGVRPYCGAWQVDASDMESVPAYARDAVLEALEAQAWALYCAASAGDDA